MKMTLEQAINNFVNGFPAIRIKNAACPENGGIKRLPEQEQINAIAEADGFSGTLCKFVPASGAATRMFKDLYSAYDELKAYIKAQSCGICCNGGNLSEEAMRTIDRLVENASGFPVHLDSEFSGESGLEHGLEIIRQILDSDKLDLGAKPKGLLPFHKYIADTQNTCHTDDYIRTAFEEHLVEGALYAKDSNGNVRMEFTVSPEHIAEFESLYNKVKAEYEKKYNCSYDVTFSVQSSDTDIVAVDLDNKPFRKEDGTLLYRPGGHGALLQNLNNITSDFVFIKNIDNVVKEERISEIVRWKKILLGRAIELRAKCAEMASKLSLAHDTFVADSANASDTPARMELKNAIENAKVLLSNEFCVEIPHPFMMNRGDIDELVATLLSKLDRPIRVCGMVKNEGEPGGGPFICYDKDGSTSLQILESAQIDKTLYSDEIKNSTHFNPVDLVCSVKDSKGEKFDLMKYSDPAAGFITEKSYKGQTIKAQEYPGLWNGAMSDWNTQFVEVPLSTFNPVKTFWDLLRPAHQ